PLFDGKHGVWCPSILGMVSVLAPTLGPTVGGVITEAVDWRWIFFINVGPGAAVTVLAIILIYVDGAEPSMFKRIDWLHLLAMAVFLGGLEYVLEEGPRLEWFGDHSIMISAWLSVVAFVLFLERSFFSGTP